jgi:hypothetical protein
MMGEGGGRRRNKRCYCCSYLESMVQPDDEFRPNTKHFTNTSSTCRSFSLFRTTHGIGYKQINMKLKID